jgi:phosphate/sulfate permease
MKILIRTVAFILLIGTTIIFILKVRINLPISNVHLLVGFSAGAASLLWTNLRESAELRKREEELLKKRMEKRKDPENK